MRGIPIDLFRYVVTRKAAGNRPPPPARHRRHWSYPCRCSGVPDGVKQQSSLVTAPATNGRDNRVTYSHDLDFCSRRTVACGQKQPPWPPSAVFSAAPHWCSSSITHRASVRPRTGASRVCAQPPANLAGVQFSLVGLQLNVGRSAGVLRESQLRANQGSSHLSDDEGPGRPLSPLDVSASRLGTNIGFEANWRSVVNNLSTALVVAP